ncbi:hypothetical protein [Natrinema salaciae]|uniref:Uncharacterized protein n=1 Tax=Natrinema salaciae TaxID=1186196 RepID=A0A1H9JMS7_9EURY|nr:hypothetical protein [Natrinema salaciae]SEQ88140.1 hypothetical protein SAMN04489841_2623 [Natrinema salaciae]
MNRRTVIAGVVATVPLLSGCSETGTSIRLEPRDVRVVGEADDGWTWDVTYDAAYELDGLDEDEGFYGVRSHLVDARGRELDRIEHGDLAWNALPTEDRTKEDREDGTKYEGTSHETVSVTTNRFPRWIVFTIDRVVASGRWIVSVDGVTAADPGPQSPANDDRNRTESDADPNRTKTDDGDHVTEPDIDSDRLEVAGDDWDRIELPEYESFPPTDVIANASEPSNERRADPPTNGSETTAPDSDSNSSR